MKKFNSKTIRKKRRALDMTQKALAAKAGITRQYMVYIERGRANPSEKVIDNIEKALKEREVKYA